MENFFIDYKYLIVPFFVWLGLQILKVILYKCNTKVSTTLTTMIGKNIGMKSPLFALSAIFTFIVMYDAAGIRRNVGEQAKILNEMNKKSNELKYVKLQEMTGHTPIQVFLGWLVGVLVGILF